MTVSFVPGGGELIAQITNTGTLADNRYIRPVLLVDPVTLVPASPGGSSTSINRANPALTVVTVTTGSTQVLAANALRKGIILQNNGANAITVDLAGGTVVAGSGIVLGPNGGSITLDGALVPVGLVTGIAVTASTALVVYEFS